MATCLRHITKVVSAFTVGYHVGQATYWVLIGDSCGELGRFIATQFANVKCDINFCRRFS